MTAEELRANVKAKIAAAPMDTEHFYWAVVLHPDEAKLLEWEASYAPKAWKQSIGLIDGCEVVPSETVPNGEIRLLRRRKDGAEL